MAGGFGMYARNYVASQGRYVAEPAQSDYQKFSIERFDVVRASKLLIADASKLRVRVPEKRIWVVSPKGIAEWDLKKVDQSPDGDIAGWTYKASPSELEKFPALAEWELLIVNS